MSLISVAAEQGQLHRRGGDGCLQMKKGVSARAPHCGHFSAESKAAGSVVMGVDDADGTYLSRTALEACARHCACEESHCRTVPSRRDCSRVPSTAPHARRSAAKSPLKRRSGPATHRWAAASEVLTMPGSANAEVKTKHAVIRSMRSQVPTTLCSPGTSPGI